MSNQINAEGLESAGTDEFTEDDLANIVSALQGAAKELALNLLAPLDDDEVALMVAAAEGTEETPVAVTRHSDPDSGPYILIRGVYSADDPENAVGLAAHVVNLPKEVAVETLRQIAAGYATAARFDSLDEALEAEGEADTDV